MVVFGVGVGSACSGHIQSAKLPARLESHSAIFALVLSGNKLRKPSLMGSELLACTSGLLNGDCRQIFDLIVIDALGLAAAPQGSDTMFGPLPGALFEHVFGKGALSPH